VCSSNPPEQDEYQYDHEHETKSTAELRANMAATLARIEPGTLAALGCIDSSADGWRRSRPFTSYSFCVFSTYSEEPAT